MSEKATPEIWKDFTTVMHENLHELNDHTIENLIYSLTRSRIKDEKLWQKISELVVSKRMIVDDKINEFCFLLGMMDNNIDIEELWQHLDEKFEKLSQHIGDIPVDLLALYANCLSKVKTKEEQKQYWDVVEKATLAEENKKYEQH